jgi:hypothetical protein
MSSEEVLPVEPEKGGRRLNAEKARGRVLMLWFGLGLLIAAVGWFLMHLGIPSSWTGPGEGVFSRAPMLWLDWLLMGLVGVLLYVLSSAAYWYIRNQGRYINFTPWYLSTIVKGPILAFVILLFLTKLQVKLSGIDIDLSKMDANLLVVAAFVLGFYSRVAREQLNQIVKALFGKAYSAAEEAFSIVPARAPLVFGGSVQFRTSAAVDVTWLASAGQMQDGLYTAPASTEAKSGQVVQITAVPKDPNIPRAVAQVTLMAFEIAGKIQVAFGASETYRVVPAPAEGVTWSVTPALTVPAISDQGVFTAPAQDVAQAAQVNKVTISASNKQKPEDSATLEVTLG